MTIVRNAIKIGHNAAPCYRHPRCSGTSHGVASSQVKTSARAWLLIARCNHGNAAVHLHAPRVSPPQPPNLIFRVADSFSPQLSSRQSFFVTRMVTIGETSDFWNGRCCNFLRGEARIPRVFGTLAKRDWAILPSWWISLIT